MGNGGCTTTKLAINSSLLCGVAAQALIVFCGGRVTATLIHNLTWYKRFIGRLACFWYINEDIPDINLFSDSLGAKFTTVDAYTHLGYNLISSKHCAPLDKKNYGASGFLNPNVWKCTSFDALKEQYIGHHEIVIQSLVRFEMISAYNL